MKSFFKWPGSVAEVDDWFTPGRFACLLAVLMVMMFHEVLFGLETFFYRDFGLYGYPLAHHVRESLWQGEIPLWNPLNNCGLPFLAQWNTMALYPPSLFYVLFPLSWALGVFCLMHMFLGGIGMYFLAHRWVGNRLAASVAGLVFAINGFTWHSLMWPNNIAAFAWLPWVVWAMERAWTEGGRRVIVAGLIGTLQMLSGAPEIIVLTWVFISLLWLVEGRRGPGGGEWAGWANVGRCAAVIGIITGLAAIQLLPFLDLLKHSQRNTVYGGMEWAMPGLGWANFLVPLFHAFPSSHGVYAQHGQYWTASYYLGAGAAALALWAAWRIPDRRVWLLTGLSTVCLVLALGSDGFLLSWLHSVLPQLGFMRFPVKFVTLVIFAAPLLAAFAVSRYRAGASPAADRRTLILTTASILVLMGLILWCAREYPLQDNDWGATWKNAAGRAGLLLAAIGLLVVSSRIRTVQWRLASALGLLLIGWVDVWTHSSNINPTVERRVYAPGLVRDSAGFNPQPLHGLGRARVASESLLGMRHSFVSTPAEDYLGRRLALLANCNLLDGIPQLSGFYSLYLKEADEILDPLRYAKHGEGEALIRFLNVSQAIAPGTLMDWKPRESFQALVTGGQNPVYVDDETSRYVVGQAKFEPGEVVFLPLEAAGQIRATNRTEVAVSSTQASAHEITFDVSARDRALVTVAQSFYHPWRAYVDGIPTRLWRGNHAFQTIEVPAGQHHVRLVYRDTMFLIGSLITLATALGCAVFWLRLRPAERASGQAGAALASIAG